MKVIKKMFWCYKEINLYYVKEILKFMSSWMDENEVEYIRPILPSQNSIVIACKW